MKEIISGWVMILDMYYYRKRLMKRYHRIKYYQRHRTLKSDSVGFIDHLISCLYSVYNFCFKRSNKYKSNSLNEAIRKQLEINNSIRLSIEARVKNNLEKHQDCKLDGYRLGVFNQDEVRMLLDNREISQKMDIPEIGVDKDLLSELESKMSYRKII